MNTINNLKPKICYKAWISNDAIRYNSSSGGVFSALANQVLLNDGVVFGSAFDIDGMVYMQKAETQEELTKLLGSKYVQARTSNIFKTVKESLKTYNKVLFCSTPCQCNALVCYLGGSCPDNLMIVDFICHGVPSEETWRKYLKHLSQGKKISKISFRDKSISWQNFGTKIIYEDGTEYFKHHKEDPYMKLFLSNRILRPSCYKCKAKGNNRVSDITLGDFWGEKGQKEKLGCSVVLVNTPKGEKLFDEACTELEYLKIAYEEAIRNNSNYRISCGVPFNRNKVLKKISKESNVVFKNTDFYTRTSLVEKVIRRGLRILRKFIPDGKHKGYLVSNKKKRFIDNAQCCGCGACESICPVSSISMELDKEGFRYPVINNELCCNCGACVKICPNT